MPSAKVSADGTVAERVYVERKARYKAKLEKMFDTYSHVLLCNADNVGSSQMQAIRLKLRGKGALVMGKNTMIRKVLRDRIPENPKLAPLLEYIVGNVGLVFTDGDLAGIRKMIEENKVPAAARVGAFAPVDVFIPPGPTGLDPGQTNFFQALQIATKIVKGTIEIMNEVHLIKKGDRVSASAVSLLSKLNLRPFFFSMMVEDVYDDGAMYKAVALDMSTDDLLAKFSAGVTKLAAVSLAAGLPNLATLPHSLARAFKNMVALAVVTDLTFKGADKYKEYLADPAAYAAKHGLSAGPAKPAAAAAAAAPAAGKPAPAAKAPEPEEEEEASGFSLFD